MKHVGCSKLDFQIFQTWLETKKENKGNLYFFIVIFCCNNSDKGNLWATKMNSMKLSPVGKLKDSLRIFKKETVKLYIPDYMWSVVRFVFTITMKEHKPDKSTLYMSIYLQKSLWMDQQQSMTKDCGVSKGESVRFCSWCDLKLRSLHLYDRKLSEGYTQL